MRYIKYLYLISLHIVLVGMVILYRTGFYKHDCVEIDSNRIFSSEVTVEDCRIKLQTQSGDIFLRTNYSKESKCYQFVLSAVSSTGKYVAFQDVSGPDSQIKVYTRDMKDAESLDILGTAEIFDLAFLPNEKLVVLYGYKGSYNEQLLKIYDIPQIIFHANNVTKVPVADIQHNYSRNIRLPNVGKDYFSVAVSDGKLLIYGTHGRSSEALQEYNLSEL